MHAEVMTNVNVCEHVSVWHAGCDREDLLDVEYELHGDAPPLLSVQIEMSTEDPSREDVKLVLRALSKQTFDLGANFTYESCYWSPCACSNMHGSMLQCDSWHVTCRQYSAYFSAPS